MIKHWKFTAKFIVFLMVTIITVESICQLLACKIFTDYIYGYATSPTFMNFHDLEDYSIDVLFLGSSHAETSFIPQELYNEYGITSYNLGSNAQSVALSYYILKDALRSQHPKVVVLETRMLFPYYDDEPLNCEDGEIRRVLNHMQWSSVKFEAIFDLCSQDDTLNLASYLLTNIEYHDRWKELNEDDFRAEERRWDGFLLGYEMFTSTNDPSEYQYQPLQEGSSNEIENMMPLMEEYLDKIASLCVKEDIELILVKTPTTDHSIGRHNALQQYANEHNITFYDFNMENLYNGICFDFYTDLCDYGHLNLSGAMKITTGFGLLLQQVFSLESHEDVQWETFNSCYEDVLKNYELTLIEDLNTYLSDLAQNKDRYSIFIMAQDDASSSLSESTQNLLKDLGLSADWTDAYRKSYCAVIVDGCVIMEKMSEESIIYTGAFQNGSRIFTISSGGFTSGISCSLKLDSNDTELAQQSRGLNIVVYDNEQHILADSVCFDTYDWSNGVQRTE